MKRQFSRLLAVVLAVLFVVPMFVFEASALTPITYRAGYNNISSSYAGSHYYSNFQKIQLTGDGRTDVLAVALSQLGYMEGNSAGSYAGTSAGSGNYTEYCYNMGPIGNYGYQWCATFCSWALYQSRCSNQMGSGYWCRYNTGSSSHIWCEVSCPYWTQQLIKYGYYQYSAYNGGSYTPQGGDLIFFKSSGVISHIGIVLYVSGGYVYTVEGNTGGSLGVVSNGGRVCAKSYALGSSSIHGYGVLPYAVVDNEYTNIDYSGNNRTPGYHVNPDAAKYIYSDEACTNSIGVVNQYTMFEVTQVCASGKVKCIATISDGSTVTGYMDPSANRIIQITASGVTYSQEYYKLKELINDSLDLICVDYTASEAIAVRAAYANAVNVINSDSSTDADYISAYNALYAAMNPTGSIVSTGKYYTRTAPDRDDAYADDNVKLTDGIKGAADGGTNGHSGWIGGTDIVVDLGWNHNVNTFTAYLAAGCWGIDVPDGKIYLEVFTSFDGANFTSLGSTNNAVLKKGSGLQNETWSVYEITLSTVTTSARYVKFTLTNSSGDHIWLDEVEAAYYTEPFLADKLYINNINSKVTSGQCVIFTPAFGTITADNANHVWTYNVVAKWDEAQFAYVVTYSAPGVGTADDITIASDEIFIAAHCWEGQGIEDAFPGSALNYSKLSKCKVGDLIQLSNITVSLGYYDVLAYASLTYKDSGTPECNHNYVAKVEDPTCTEGGYTVYTCSNCGDIYTENNTASKGHTPGEWITLEDGSQELRCKDCDHLLETLPAPAPEPVYGTGDVNADGNVDMFDYLVIKNIYFQYYTPNAGEFERADIDNSGEIDLFDYMAVKTCCFQ